MSLMLLSDDVTVCLVELYAARRGLNRNEAMRRLVRTGLGVDPVGPWRDKRTKTDGKLTAAVRQLRPRRRAKNIPEGHEEMFSELKHKVGASEARRLVAEHAAIVARRA